ncbi:hypothetical protein M438DRAFT_377596 [Aureobasidium pullulans EXF-150]|uniref:Uncharacterized protein n=1 Tax=Aureobasidium pullulans EXF-150 TaxID=1043002 RepID=A0A074X405_AURPU|nr:uncharacterized protein M438DRAFT_377596 [Aureobasidium pullulans EXF-150]KEQ80230.1 hypothetical protein M438DRAFT_377596 [Aureobasidium pullulans EXF-150]
MLIRTVFGIMTFITHNYNLSGDDYSKIKLLYCASLIFIKSSICVALIRLIVTRRLLYTLYAILALSASYGFIAIMTGIIVYILYFVTACLITTDLAYVVIPRLKFIVATMLSLGFLASAAIIVRIKYLDSYFTTEDLTFKVSNVSFALRSIGRHGHHKTHISGKASKDLDKDDSIKDILTNDLDIILVRLESFKSFTF